MSLFDTVQQPCPNCGTVNAMRVFRTLNVTQHPELKGLLFDQEVNRYQCGRCGLDAQADLPLIYNDMERGLMIALVPPGEDPSGLDDILTMAPEGMLAQTRLRIVEEMNSLLEKVLIDEAGLDDRVMEVVKLTAQAQSQDLAGKEIRFNGLETEEGETSVSFCALDADGPRFFSAPRGMAYDAVALAFEEKHQILSKAPNGAWFRVDAEWALKACGAR